MRHSFARSGVLVLSHNSAQSLLPATLISQAESLLESHRLEDAAHLADQQRRKLQEQLHADEDEAEELRYVFQRIAFQCFSETLFEDAGKRFLDGGVDPRLLISYYPDLRGSLLREGDVSHVFAGVAEHMPRDGSVDDIIAINLVRNYSPHLAPSTRTAPPTAELSKILGMAAGEMLEVFLKKSRIHRKPADPLNNVVDTVLCKLYAKSENTAELYKLVESSDSIVLSEIEPVLKETGQYNALCTLYKRQGQDGLLLDAWSKLVEGEWTDDDISDPLSLMIGLITERRDRALSQKWGVWITKRDPERGLKLLMSRESKRKERPEDELAMLQQLQETSPGAGAQFLEHLVLQKRSMDRSLHMKLAMACLDQVVASLSVESVAKLWRAKTASYASNPSTSSFLTYFASTTPDSDHKRSRLKTILFLQASSLYDVGAIRARLLDHQKILKLELAIIEGKLGNHKGALSILVHDLKDASSAEAYCTLGGELIPAKVAQAVGYSCGLTQWSTALFFPSTGNGKSSAKLLPIARTKSVDEVTKTSLLKILLEVYMSDEETTADRAAHLLNSQAMNLDVVDVIPLVPPNWPLSAMSSFLTRSFRRTLHAHHEGQIVKAISAGQNLAVKDRTWLPLREHGAIVEEAGSDDEDDEDSDEDASEEVSGDEKFNEKSAISEKAPIGVQSVDIIPPSDEERTFI